MYHFPGTHKDIFLLSVSPKALEPFAFADGELKDIALFIHSSQCLRATAPSKLYTKLLNGIDGAEPPSLPPLPRPPSARDCTVSSASAGCNSHILMACQGRYHPKSITAVKMPSAGPGLFVFFFVFFSNNTLQCSGSSRAGDDSG